MSSALKFNPLTKKLEQTYVARKPVDGKDGKDGIDGQSIVGPQGPPGKDGKDGQSIIGPQGLPGKDGSDGKDGKDGINGKSIIGPMGPAGKPGLDAKPVNSIYNTISMPDNSLGINGDFCFTDINEIFIKKNGKWKFYNQIGGGASPQFVRSLANDLIRREVYNISTNQTLGANNSRDYYYFVTGTVTVTMPTAVGNKNKYTVKNVGNGIVTIDFTGSETGDEALEVLLTIKNTSIVMLSDGSNWRII